MDKMEELREWIEKYEFLSLVTLNCSHNNIPSLKKLSLFKLPRLESLNLSEYIFPKLAATSRTSKDWQNANFLFCLLSHYVQRCILKSITTW